MTVDSVGTYQIANVGGLQTEQGAGAGRYGILGRQLGDSGHRSIPPKFGGQLPRVTDLPAAHPIYDDCHLIGAVIDGDQCIADRSAIADHGAPQGSGLPPTVVGVAVSEADEDGDDDAEQGHDRRGALKGDTV